jgi:divalent metal cation (Fe/Co/Zn/Cd) transporter
LVRLILVLVGTLIIGGLGAIYVWKTINELLRGDASWHSVALAAIVLVGIFALLIVVFRYLSRMEDLT